MKKLILIISLLLAGQVAYGQRLWGSDEILFAQNWYYANVSIGWTSTKGGGSTFSIIPEVGRILNKHASFGLSDFVSIFLRGSFSGYQWSRENGGIAARWKLFRFDEFDHCVGVSFFF